MRSWWPRRNWIRSTKALTYAVFRRLHYRANSSGTKRENRVREFAITTRDEGSDERVLRISPLRNRLCSLRVSSSGSDRSVKQEKGSPMNHRLLLYWRIPKWAMFFVFVALTCVLIESYRNEHAEFTRSSRLTLAYGVMMIQPSLDGPSHHPAALRVYPEGVTKSSGVPHTLSQRATLVSVLMLV